MYVEALSEVRTQYYPINKALRLDLIAPAELSGIQSFISMTDKMGFNPDGISGMAI